MGLMDDPKWIRLVTIGLVLSAIAVGYFLLSGRFASNTTKTQGQISKASPTPSASPRILGAVQPSPSATASAYNRIAERTQSGVSTLPATGSPIIVVTLL